MTRALFAIAFATLVSACAPQQAEKVPVSILPTEFQSQDYPGSGSISGQAFIKQRGGGVVTCAGNEVFLMPDTAGSDRMRLLFAQAKAPIPTVNGKQPSVAYPNSFKKTRCNAQGSFGFSNLAPGRWIVFTAVYWSVGNNPEGGLLWREVPVIQGSDEEIVMTGSDAILSE